MTELQEIAFDALREMYSEAEPPLDFDYVLENPEEYDDDWYDYHYLDGDRQTEILETHCEEHDLTDREQTQITITVILDLGPRSIPREEIEQ